MTTVKNIGFLEFLQIAAVKITGEYVEISIEPPLRGKAEAYPLTGEGRGFGINIHPGAIASGDEYLEAFLHECAHIRLHGEWMQTSQTDHPAAKRALYFENEAQSLGLKWISNFCNKSRADNWDVGEIVDTTAAGHDMARRLTALMAIPDDVQARYDVQTLASFRTTEQLESEMARRLVGSMNRAD